MLPALSRILIKKTKTGFFFQEIPPSAMPKQLTPEQSTLIERKRKAALELRSKRVINVVTPDHSICERKENHCDEFHLESGCDCRKAFYEQVCQSKHCSLLIHVGDCIDKFIVGFNAKKKIPICGWCHVWCPDDKKKQFTLMKV